MRDAREVPHYGADTPGPSPLPAEFWPRLEQAPRRKYEQWQPSGYAGYAVECLEAAVWCVLNCASYEDAIIQCVNLAGEADTMAAVAGGAAGALWGERAIPSRWLDVLFERSEIEKLADELWAVRRHGEIYATRGLPAFGFGWLDERVAAAKRLRPSKRCRE